MKIFNFRIGAETWVYVQGMLSNRHGSQAEIRQGWLIY